MFGKKSSSGSKSGGGKGKITTPFTNGVMKKGK
jgi:hypothetical protein